MKKDETKMVTARLPSSLVKQLDKSAKRSHRSRTSELEVLLKVGLSPARSRSAA